MVSHPCSCSSPRSHRNNSREPVCASWDFCNCSNYIIHRGAGVAGWVGNCCNCLKLDVWQGVVASCRKVVSLTADVWYPVGRSCLVSWQLLKTTRTSGQLDVVWLLLATMMKKNSRTCSINDQCRKMPINAGSKALNGFYSDLPTRGIKSTQRALLYQCRIGIAYLKDSLILISLHYASLTSYFLSVL